MSPIVSPTILFIGLPQANLEKQQLKDKLKQALESDTAAQQFTETVSATKTAQKVLQQAAAKAMSDPKEVAVSPQGPRSFCDTGLEPQSSSTW